MFQPNLMLMTGFLKGLLPAIKESKPALWNSMQSVVYFGEGEENADIKEFKHVLKHDQALKDAAKEYKGFEKTMLRTIREFATFERIAKGRSLDQVVEDMHNRAMSDQIDADFSELCFRFCMNVEREVAREQGVEGAAVLIVEEQTKKGPKVKAIAASEVEAAKAELGDKAAEYHMDTWNPYIGGMLVEVESALVQQTALEISNNLLESGLVTQSIADAGEGLTKLYARTKDGTGQVEVYIDAEGKPTHMVDVVAGTRQDFDQEGRWQDALAALALHSASNPEAVVGRAEQDPGAPAPRKRRGPTRAGLMKIDPSAYGGVRDKRTKDHEKIDLGTPVSRGEIPKQDFMPEEEAPKSKKDEETPKKKGAAGQPLVNLEAAPLMDDFLKEGAGAVESTRNTLEQRGATPRRAEAETDGVSRGKDGARRRGKESRRDRTQELAAKRKLQKKQPIIKPKQKKTLADAAIKGSALATALFSGGMAATSFMI